MGIPQGSVAGPILFLVFINDLPNASDLFTILFADNTTLQCNSSCLHTLYSTVNYNLKLIERWFSANLLTLNTKKTKYILFSSNKKSLPLSYPTLMLANCKIDRIGAGCKEESFKFLGHIILLV